MSNRLYQTVLHQMKDVIGRTIGIIDENGIIIACSELSKIGESKQRIREELSYSSDAVIYEGYTYRFINGNEKTKCSRPLQITCRIRKSSHHTNMLMFL